MITCLSSAPSAQGVPAALAEGPLLMLQAPLGRVSAGVKSALVPGPCSGSVGTQAPMDEVHMRAVGPGASMYVFLGVSPH